MSYILNPFTGQFDFYVGGATATYSSFASFPASAADGALAVALDTDTLYVFNLGTTTWLPIGKPGDALSVGVFDSSSPSANGLQINAAQAIIAQSASAANPGMVNTTAQTLAGAKTFSTAPILSSLTVSTALTLDGSNNIVSSTTTATELGYVHGVTSAIQTQLNGKQASGNYITALTGDGTASGPGSAALTLATVNSNTGAFGSASTAASFTVNGKGLITAAAATSIQIAESQVTNLVSDLAGKQATGNYITALTGDITASGPGSVASTLATVNTNTGAFGSSTSIPTITVNGKGLITAASSNVVIAPAGTVTGTTLASNVVTSSLTTVGTIGTGTWQGTPIATTYGGLGVNTTPANGAVPIGTGSGYTVTTLTAGTGISITNASGSITIANAEAITGDIPLTSFSIANNISSAANITGLAFSNAAIRSAWVYYSIIVSASSTSYEAGTLQLVQNGAGWYMSQNYVGLDSGITISVTTGGQLQYTSPNYSGFSSGKIQFRALVTPV